MNMIGQFAILIVLSYLVGSIPFGLMIARAGGKNLRDIGSGNIGATNLGRAMGRKWVYVCFVLDALKGFLPMMAASYFLPEKLDTLSMFLWLGVGIGAIAGHIFPVYINFRGGKGVSTGFGMILGVWPYYTLCGLIALVVWLLCLLIWRYVSLASIIASISFCLSLFVMILFIDSWEMGALWPLLVVATAMPILIVTRHWENIRRIKEGTESKVFTNKKNIDG